MYISRNYGLLNEKPSLYCFNLIKNKIKCKWKDITYVGDNPNKDFVNLNKKKATTIRILTGNYKELKVSKNMDGKYKINDLKELFELNNRLNFMNS